MEKISILSIGILAAQLVVCCGYYRFITRKSAAVDSIVCSIDRINARYSVIAHWHTLGTISTMFGLMHGCVLVYLIINWLNT
jgi:hypothetical protein